jgi:hypothetical protein
MTSPAVEKPMRARRCWTLPARRWGKTLGSTRRRKERRLFLCSHGMDSYTYFLMSISWLNMGLRQSGNAGTGQ